VFGVKSLTAKQIRTHFQARVLSQTTDSKTRLKLLSSVCVWGQITDSKTKQELFSSACFGVNSLIIEQDIVNCVP
jgi:hypothetical protein